MEVFLYFAYGSNMLSTRLQGRTPSATAVGIGFVEGRRLAFHKVSADKSGKCNIEATGIATDRAYGVLFNIDAAEKEALDKAEGLGKGYDSAVVSVVQMDGIPVPAIAYAATKVDPKILPYEWYKALVVSGAVEHGLPHAYIEWIRTFHSQPDSDDKRRAKNEKLLFLS